MPAASKAAAPKKGAAARAEKEPKSVDFHGVAIQLPPSLPSSFSWRFAQITSLEDKGQIAAGKVYDLLVPRYVSEDQYEAICDAVDDSTEDASLSDLIVSIIEVYGVDAGESEASAGA